MKNGKLSKLLNTPLGIVVVVGTIALAVEILFMELLHEFLIVRFRLSGTAWGIIDAVTLTAILAPALYFLVFRKIHDSEERFRQFYAIAPNAVVIVNEQGRITDWNPAAQKMFGYGEEEAVGQRMHQLITPARYRADEERGFAHFQETGEGPVVGKVTEISALRKDGSEFPVELSISAVRLQGRWHAIGIIHNITERKQAVETLRESENRFRKLFENANDAIFIHTLTGEILDANPQAENMMGYPLAILRTMPVPALHPPEELEISKKAFEETISKGSTRFESRFRHSGGNLIDVEISARIVDSEKGIIQGVVRDITERKRAEELASAQRAEIERARLDWMAVFDSISHPIFLHDGEFRVIRANRAYAEQAGKPFKEIIGQPYYASFPKSDKPLPCCLRAMEKAEEEEEEEEVAVGGAIYRSRSFAVRNEQGVYLYSVHILEDITERKQAGVALQKSEELYRSLFENMLNGFAYCRMIFEQDQPQDFIYLSVNAAFETLTGLKNVAGKRVSEVIPGIRQSDPKLFEIYGRVSLSGQPERFEIYVEALQQWFWISVYSPEKGYFVAVFDVITERKQAEQGLRESEARFSAIAEAAGDLIFSINADGKVGYVNETAARALHTMPAQVAGKHLRDLFPAETFEQYWHNLQKVFETGKPLYVEAPSHLQYEGMWLGTWLVPLRDASGSIAAVMGDSRDITERKRVEELQRQSREQLSAALEDAIGAIAATLEQRDPYTAGHQRRVAELAAAIGGEMGLSREVLEGIHFGGLIHDLGKISVPAEILGKPGRLTGIEFGLIKIHPEAGYQIVKEIAFPWPVADMVHQHHERLDGSGYPLGLKDDQIRLEARILAVADVVEAMSANRPYRPGFGMDAALEEITRARGTQLDPVAVDACLCLIREKGFVFTK